MFFLKWRQFVADAGPLKDNIGFCKREAELKDNLASPDGNRNSSEIT